MFGAILPIMPVIKHLDQFIKRTDPASTLGRNIIFIILGVAGVTCFFLCLAIVIHDCKKKINRRRLAKQADNEIGATANKRSNSGYEANQLWKYCSRNTNPYTRTVATTDNGSGSSITEQRPRPTLTPHSLFPQTGYTSMVDAVRIVHSDNEEGANDRVGELDEFANHGELPTYTLNPPPPAYIP